MSQTFGLDIYNRGSSFAPSSESWKIYTGISGREVRTQVAAQNIRHVMLRQWTLLHHATAPLKVFSASSPTSATLGLAWRYCFFSLQREEEEEARRRKMVRCQIQPAGQKHISCSQSALCRQLLSSLPIGLSPDHEDAHDRRPHIYVCYRHPRQRGVLIMGDALLHRIWSYVGLVRSHRYNFAHNEVRFSTSQAGRRSTRLTSVCCSMADDLFGSIYTILLNHDSIIRPDGRAV
jgi:hypothetical protein